MLAVACILHLFKSPVGANLGDRDLKNIVQIDGLVSGNVKPSYRELSKKTHSLNIILIHKIRF